MNLSVSELLPYLKKLLVLFLGQSLAAQIKSAIKRMETVGIVIYLVLKTENLIRVGMQRSVGATISVPA